MFKSPKLWKKLIGSHDRIESVVTWEMACFVGIYVKLKR